MSQPMPVQPRTVVLVGPRAAGKTSVGRALAEALGLPFVDADERLAAAAGMSAGDYLRQAGEPAFRALEERVSLPLLAQPRTVVALGGGAVLSAKVRTALSTAACHTVLLIATPAVLVERQQRTAGQRPPLTDLPLDQEVAALLAARLPLYRAVAQAECDTSARAVAQIAAELAASLRAS